MQAGRNSIAVAVFVLAFVISLYFFVHGHTLAAYLFVLAVWAIAAFTLAVRR
jgi:hypothetical protein